MTNHSEIAEFLWKIADLIRDGYDAKDDEDVILPVTLLRRLDCAREPTRQAVRDATEKYKAVPDQTCDALLTKATGQFRTPRAIVEEVRLQFPAQSISVQPKNTDPFYA